jgi:hypothetical protein
MSFAQEHIDTPDMWEENRKEFFKQLAQLRKEVIAPTNQDNTTTLHAKVVITGKSAGHCDDMAMAWGILLYHMIRSLGDDAFRFKMEQDGRAIC